MWHSCSSCANKNTIACDTCIFYKQIEHKNKICFNKKQKVGEVYRSCTKKKRYRNYDEAHKMAKQCELERPETKLRVYFCSICGGFHITKKCMRRKKRI